MMATDTFSFSLYYFHFITLLKIDHREEEERKRREKKNDRVNTKNANQAKSVCDVGLSLRMYR